MSRAPSRAPGGGQTEVISYCSGASELAAELGFPVRLAIIADGAVGAVGPIPTEQGLTPGAIIVPRSVRNSGRPAAHEFGALGGVARERAR
ncbi:MAG: hypothetical protein ACLP01_13310 [Solirubrobacteraceae bacterium]